MLAHIRLTVPSDLSDDVCRLLTEHEAVTDVIRLQGAAIDPAGDLIEADVAREVTSDVIDSLQQLQVDTRGSIVMTQLTATPFERAEKIEKAAAGDPDDAVIWSQVREAADDGAKTTVSFLIFLVIAVALAAIAVITDSAILVVGAMVVGPEFATVAGICVGVVFLEWKLVARGLRTLVGGFIFAILVVTALAFVAAHTGILDPSLVSQPRPQTDFVWHPDRWSFIVALLAGAAGVLALSIDKVQAMVGVFISVTTVPAAGNMALGVALGMPNEIGGSARQLGINLLGMTIAGTLTLLAQRMAWRRKSVLERFTPPLR